MCRIRRVQQPLQYALHASSLWRLKQPIAFPPNSQMKSSVGEGFARNVEAVGRAPDLETQVATIAHSFGDPTYDV